MYSSCERARRRRPSQLEMQRLEMVSKVDKVCLTAVLGRFPAVDCFSWPPMVFGVKVTLRPPMPVEEFQSSIPVLQCDS